MLTLPSALRTAFDAWPPERSDSQTRTCYIYTMAALLSGFLLEVSFFPARK
jgi:hypothetical protein